MHSVLLTTQLIGQLQKRGIDLIVVNQRHAKHSFALFADQQLQVERRCLQYAWQVNAVDRLPFAQQLCEHKFNVLERILRDYKGTELARQQIKSTVLRVPGCIDDQQLMGYEGSLQRLAFHHWRQLLPKALGFTTRQRRPPPDPVNAALSLTYTLVHHDAVRQAKKHALDPQLGFYHRTAFGRQSLACDIMEPVRPKVEAWCAHLFIDGQLDKRHFSVANGSCTLGKAGREIFYAAYDEQAKDWQRQLDAAATWVARRLDRARARA
jgi:CRISPR-associated protein Cas1